MEFSVRDRILFPDIHFRCRWQFTRQDNTRWNTTQTKPRKMRHHVSDWIQTSLCHRNLPAPNWGVKRSNGSIPGMISFENRALGFQPGRYVACECPSIKYFISDRKSCCSDSCGTSSTVQISGLRFRLLTLPDRDRMFGDVEREMQVSGSRHVTTVWIGSGEDLMCWRWLDACSSRVNEKHDLSDRYNTFNGI